MVNQKKHERFYNEFAVIIQMDQQAQLEAVFEKNEIMNK